MFVLEKEKKECLENMKKRVERTLAAAELIRQPWAAMPRQVVDVRQQEGAAAKVSKRSSNAQVP